jgi:ribosome-binding factor A
MAQGHRPDRVGEEIRHELSELLTRGAVHDPGVGFITLTRATPFFRRHLGARLRLRRVPELEFRFDESIANQDRIEQILRDLHQEEEQRAAASERETSSATDAGSEDQAYTDDDTKR